MHHGVGITTRNRARVLRLVLEEFVKYHTNESLYVVVDDASDDFRSNHESIEWFRSQVNAEVIYRYSSNRLGIAKSKNACITTLLDCSNIFLFDDDIWPTQSRWADVWSDVADATEVGHSMYMHYPNKNDQYKPKNGNKASYRIVNSVESNGYKMNGWSNCMGVALHFNNSKSRRIRHGKR
jgi:glycosyltransferase involved in cell wall biosynthesis